MGKYSVFLILTVLAAIIAVTYNRKNAPLPAPRAPAQDVRPEENAAGPMAAVSEKPPAAAAAEVQSKETEKLIDRTEIQKPAVKPAEPFAPLAPVAIRPAMAVGDFHELILKPAIGFGGKYIVLEQSGGAGAVKGQGTTMDLLAFGMRVEYGDWNLTAGLERFHLEVAADATGSGETSVREFRKLSLLPGYGAFFAGIETTQTPVARVTGTALLWADTNLLSAVAGFGDEHEWAGGRKTPFRVGWRATARYPLKMESENGPSLSSPKGFGISASAHLEKPFYSHADKNLNLGLRTSAEFNEVKAQSVWGNYSGQLRRRVLEFEMLIYLGAGF